MYYQNPVHHQQPQNPMQQPPPMQGLGAPMQGLGTPMQGLGTPMQHLPQSVQPMPVPYYYYQNIDTKKSKSSTTWTQKEDKLLRDLKENQKLGWREISTFFNDRTPNACQFRWRRIISAMNAKSGSSSAASTPTSSPKSSISSGSPTSSLWSTPSSSIPKINKKSHHSINYILN